MQELVTEKARSVDRRSRLALRVLQALLLATAVVFVCLHWVHLRADFPNHSPWMDWAKYTDEGWYGDGAIRHFQRGHWYVAGDFNPAAALPVWPMAEALLFRFTGVGVVAARALSGCGFWVNAGRGVRVDGAPMGHGGWQMGGERGRANPVGRRATGSGCRCDAPGGEPVLLCVHTAGDPGAHGEPADDCGAIAGQRDQLCQEEGRGGVGRRRSAWRWAGCWP